MAGPASSSREERLHRLISDIYDAALLPDCPMKLLKDAARLTDSSVAMIDIVRPSEGVFGDAIYGRDPIGRQETSLYADSNLYLRRAELFAPGRAHLGHDVVRPDEWKGNPCFEEFLIKYDTVHLMHLMAVADGHCLAGLSLWRGRAEEDYGENDRILGNILARHLHRAFQIGARFSRQAARASAMDQALVEVGGPAMIVDCEGGLVQANEPAVRHVTGRGPLVLRHGRLQAREPGDQRRWRALLAGLAARNGPPTGSAALIGGSAPDEPSVVAHAIPLRPSAAEIWRVPLREKALGLLVLVCPGTPALPADLAQTAFGLTPAEAELAVALASGASLADHAAARGRSLNTVKTHLRNVFDKTGSRRQSDLVRKLTALAALTPGR